MSGRKYVVDILIMFKGPDRRVYTYEIDDELYKKVDFSSIVKITYANRSKEELAFVLRKRVKNPSEYATDYKKVKSIVLQNTINKYQHGVLNKILQIVIGNKVLETAIPLFITERMVLSLSHIKGTYTKIYTLNKNKCKEYKAVNNKQEEILKVLEYSSGSLGYGQIKELGLSINSLATLVKNKVVEESEVFDNKNIKLNYKKNEYQVDKVINHGLIIGRDKKVEKVIIDNIYANIKDGKQTLIIASSSYDVNYWFDQLKDLDINIARYHRGININDQLLTYRGLNSGVIQVVVAEQKGLFFPFSNLGQVILLNQESMNYKRKVEPKYDLNLLLDCLEGVSVLKTSLTPSIKEAFKLGNVKLPKVKPDFNYIQIKGSYDYILDKITKRNKKQLFVFLYDEKPLLRCLECGTINASSTCYRCFMKNTQYINVCEEWLKQELDNRGYQVKENNQIILNAQYTRDYSDVDEVYVFGAKYITRPLSIEGFVNEYSVLTNISTNANKKINVLVESDKKDIKLDSYPVMMENILSSLSRYQVFPYYPMVKVYIEGSSYDAVKNQVGSFIYDIRKKGIKYFYSDYIYRSNRLHVSEIPIVIRQKGDFEYIKRILPKRCSIVLL